MYTLTVMDKNASGLLPVDLLDLFRVLRSALDDVEWSISGLELSGPGAEELYDIEQRRERISTATLEPLAEKLGQVIDGEFAAHQKGAVVPFLKLRMVDSSSWDVSTDEPQLLERVRRAFTCVHEAGEVG
jgi:hypothetical protein